MCADRRGIFNYLRIPRTAERRLALPNFKPCSAFRPFFALPFSLSPPLALPPLLEFGVPRPFRVSSYSRFPSRSGALPPPGMSASRVDLASPSCPLSIVVLAAAGCAIPPAPVITYARSTVCTARPAKSDRQPFHDVDVAIF